MGRVDTTTSTYHIFLVYMSSANLASTSNNPGRFLRLPEVKYLTGLSKSSIYARMSEGRFPKQVSLGPRLVVWVDTEIEDWLKSQVRTLRG